MLQSVWDGIAGTRKKTVWKKDPKSQDVDEIVAELVKTQQALYNLNTISANRGDNAVTLVAGTDEAIQIFSTALTANRAITLSTTNAVKGDRFRIVRTGLGAFTMDVGGLKTLPSATAAFAEVMFNGTAWVLIGYGTL